MMGGIPFPSLTLGSWLALMVCLLLGVANWSSWTWFGVCLLIDLVRVGVWQWRREQ